MAKFNDFEALKNDMAQKNSNFETEFSEYMRLSFLKEQIGKKNSEDIPYNISIMVYSDGDIDNDPTLKEAYATFQNKFKNDYYEKYNAYYDAYAIQAKDYFSRLKDQKAQPKEAEVAENKPVAEINQNESEKKKVCALFVDFDDCLNPKHSININRNESQSFNPKDTKSKKDILKNYSLLNERSSQFEPGNIAFLNAYNDNAKKNGYEKVCLYPFSTRINSQADQETARNYTLDANNKRIIHYTCTQTLSDPAYRKLAQFSDMQYAGFPFDKLKEGKNLTGSEGKKNKIFQFLLTAHHVAKEHNGVSVDILVVDDNPTILNNLIITFVADASVAIPKGVSLSTVIKDVKKDTVEKENICGVNISNTRFNGPLLSPDAILTKAMENTSASLITLNRTNPNDKESPLSVTESNQDSCPKPKKIDKFIYKCIMEGIISKLSTSSTPVKDELITAITSAHNTLRELKRHHRRDSKDPNLSQDEKRLASEKYQAMKTIYNKFKQNLRNLDNALYSCMPMQNSNALANDNSNNNSSVTKIDNIPVNQAIYTFCKDCNHLFLAPKQSKQNSKDSNNELDKVYDTLKKPADDFGALVFKCRKFVMAVVRHGFFNALNKPTETRTTEILGSQAGKLKELAEKNKPTP